MLAPRTDHLSERSWAAWDLNRYKWRVSVLGIENYPSLLDFYMPTESEGLTAREVLRNASDWLVASLQYAEIATEFMGAVDVLEGRAGEDWCSLANSLDCALGGVRRNLGKFEGFHDLMICPIEQAEQFGKHLGPDVRVRRITGRQIAVVEVPTEQGWRNSAKGAVAHLFTAPPNQSDSGRGPTTYAFYSKREYENLDRRGMVPRLTGDEVLHPVLDAKWSETLGIERDQMIVLPMHRMLAAQISRELGDLSRRESYPWPLDECERIYCRYLHRDYVARIFKHLRSTAARGRQEAN